MGSFRLLIQRVLLVLLLGLVIWFCWTQRETLARARILSPLELIIVLGCYSFVFLLNGAMATLMLRRRHFKASFAESFAINCWSSLLGYFTVLRLGYYSGRAWYLQRMHGVPLTTGLGMMAYMALAALFVNAIAGLVVGVAAWQNSGVVVPFLYWVVILVTLALCLATLFVIGSLDSLKERLPARVAVWVGNVRAVFTSTSSGELAVVTTMLAISIPLQSQALGILFQVYGQPLPWIYLLFLAIFSTLSMVVSLTPANLGVREIVLLLVVAHLDVPATEVLSVLLVDRVLQFLLVLLLGVSGYALLLRPAQLQVQPAGGDGK